jgi:hypothetical protein
MAEGTPAKPATTGDALYVASGHAPIQVVLAASAGTQPRTQ